MASANAQTASEVVDRFFAKLSQETLTGSYSATLSNEQGQPAGTYTGFLEMRGEVFHARILDTEIAYDGTTLSTYDEDMNELTLTYPTPEELQEGNPLLYAKAMAEWCTPMFAPEQPQGMYFLLLLPKIQGSEIVNISIILHKSDLLPETIIMKQVTGTTTVRLQQQRWSQQPPVTTIPTETEGKEKPFVNDLR